MGGRGTGGTAALVIAALMVAVLSFAAPASAARIEVETGADQFGSGPECSLREAFRSANDDTAFGGCRSGDGRDTLLLGSRTHTLTRTGADDDTTTNGDLDVTEPVTIRGRDADSTKIDGNGATVGERVMEVLGSGQVRVLDLAVVDGFATSPEGNGGGINLDGDGALVVRRSRISNNRAAVDGAGLNVDDSGGVLRINSSTVTRNLADSNGGGINAEQSHRVVVLDMLIADNEVDGCCNGGGIDIDNGDLVVKNSEIRGNTVEGNGAGIYGSGDELEISDSSIVNNSTTGNGGGLLTRSGPSNVRGTTIARNDAFIGGGIVVINDGPLDVLNSTISGNAADRSGGGIGVTALNGSVELRSTTVADNVADADQNMDGDGGGVFVNEDVASSAFSLLNTLLAGNRDRSGNDEDCAGPLMSEGYNLVGVDGCIDDQQGDQIGTASNPIDPRIGPLASNDGATKTHTLRSNSPAVNAGNPGQPGSGDPACPQRDQRGEPRSNCDIGAFER